MRISLDELKTIIKTKLKIRPIMWRGDALLVLDQRKIPFEESYVELSDVVSVANAIRDMIVRGAPAIGITAAYGMALSLIRSNIDNLNEALERLGRAAELLNSSRPTAVNLMWATRRMYNRARDAIHNGEARTVGELIDILRNEANSIFEEEFEAELRIGVYGLEKLSDGDTVITQCNAGGLATGTGLGTALAPVKLAHVLGMRISVVAPETRPWLQGARLTTYELMMEGIDVTLIADTAVGLVMYRGIVNEAMVGADRVLSDGHVFNKVGTLNEAIIAHELGIPFYALAPSSSFDLESKPSDVKIEERDPDEVRRIRGVPIAPEGIKVLNPVFDITPPKYVTAIITEKGIIYPPYSANIRRILGGG